MVGDGGDGGSTLEAELGVLGMSVCLSLCAVEDGLHELVDGILRDAVVGDDDCLDSDGGDVSVLTLVGAGLDGVSCVVGAGGQKLLDMLLVQGTSAGESSVMAWPASLANS